MASAEGSPPTRPRVIKPDKKNDQGVARKNSASQLDSKNVTKDDEHILRILGSYTELLDDEDGEDKSSSAYISSQNDRSVTKHGATEEPNESSLLSKQVPVVTKCELPHSSVRSVTMPAQDVPPRMLSLELLEQLAQNKSLRITFDVRIHPGFDVIHDSFSEALDKHVIMPIQLPITRSSPSPTSTRQFLTRKLSLSMLRWPDFSQKASGNKCLSVPPVVTQEPGPGHGRQLQSSKPKPKLSDRFVHSRENNGALDIPVCTSDDTSTNPGYKTPEESPVLPELAFRRSGQHFSAVFDKAKADLNLLVGGVSDVSGTSVKHLSLPDEKCREESAASVKDLPELVQESSHMSKGEGTEPKQPQLSSSKLFSGDLDVIVRPNPWIERARDLGRPIPIPPMSYSSSPPPPLPPKATRVQTPPRRVQYSYFPPMEPTAPRRERVGLGKQVSAPAPSSSRSPKPSTSGTPDQLPLPPTRVFESRKGLISAKKSVHFADDVAVVGSNPDKAASIELADIFPRPPNHNSCPVLAEIRGHSRATKASRSLAQTAVANRHPTAASLGISASSSADFSRVPRSTLHKFHQAEARKPWSVLQNRGQKKTATSLGLARAASLHSLRPTHSQQAPLRHRAAHTGPYHTPAGDTFAVNSKSVNTATITRISGNRGSTHQNSPPSPVQWPFLRGDAEDIVPKPLKITKRLAISTPLTPSGTPVLPNSKTLASSPFPNTQASVLDALSTSRLRKAASTPEFGSRATAILGSRNSTLASSSFPPSTTIRLNSASVPKIPSTGPRLETRHPSTAAPDLDTLSLINEQEEVNSVVAVSGSPESHITRNKEAQLKFLRDTVDQLLPELQPDPDATVTDVSALHPITVVHPTVTVPHIVITDWDYQYTQDSLILKNESPDELGTMGNIHSKIDDGSSKLFTILIPKRVDSTNPSAGEAVIPGQDAATNNEQSNAPVGTVQPSGNDQPRPTRPHLPPAPRSPLVDPLSPLAIQRPVRHGYPQLENLSSQSGGRDVRSPGCARSFTTPIPSPSYFGTNAEEELIFGPMSLSPPSNSRAEAPSRGRTRERPAMPLSGREFQDSTDEVFVQRNLHRLSRIMENHSDEDIAIRWDTNLRRMSQQGTRAVAQQPIDSQAGPSGSQQSMQAVIQPPNESQAVPSWSQQGIQPVIQQPIESQAGPSRSQQETSTYGRDRTSTGDSIGSGSIVRPAPLSDVFTSETRQSNLLYSASAGGASTTALEHRSAFATGFGSEFGYNEVNAASTPAGPSSSPITGPGLLHASNAALDTPTNTGFQQQRRRERLQRAIADIRAVYQTDPQAATQAIRELLTLYDIPEDEAAAWGRAVGEQGSASTAVPASAPASAEHLSDSSEGSQRQGQPDAASREARHRRGGWLAAYLPAVATLGGRSQPSSSAAGTGGLMVRARRIISRSNRDPSPDPDPKGKGKAKAI